MDTASSAVTGSDRFGLSLSRLFKEFFQAWPWLVATIVLSVAAAALIVRQSPPMYAAAMSMTKTSDVKASSLSILSEAAGGAGGADSSADELRATLSSRVLVARVLRQEPIAGEIRKWFAPQPPTTLERARRFVAKTLFGQRPKEEADLAERLRVFLKANLTVEYEKGLLEGRVVTPDRAFSEHLLRATMTEARRIMRRRQQARAIATREFMSTMLNERSAQISTLVVNDQMSRAIGDAIAALSPSSEKFEVIDDVYADARPVSPRIGLILAICLGIGLTIFAGAVSVRALATHQHV